MITLYFVTSLLTRENPPDKTTQRRIYKDAIKNVDMDSLPTGVTLKRMRREVEEEVEDRHDVDEGVLDANDSEDEDKNRMLLEALIKDKKYRDAKRKRTN